MSKKIAVFAAWPYANGPLHIGHIAGAYLPADIFARFNRLIGNEVMMVSGSDSHGTPITIKAKEEKCTPIEVLKRYHRTFLEGWQGLGISFDLFTWTHTANHAQISQDIFTRLYEQGDLTVKSQEQFYDEHEKMFLPDRYVTGTCPICGNERARGDQCENCGATFDATELKNPISILSGKTPEIKETEHFFFELGKYQDKLNEYISKNPHWRISVQNLTQSMIELGIQSRPITRDIEWGVPVPIAGWESKVMYVWFEAVIGYLSASVEYSKDSGKPWKGWWCDKEALSYYFIGKDNVPFHTVIWPIELMAYDKELNLPYDVPANQFLNLSGDKFSTSRGHAVWLSETIAEYDPDALRFYLTTIMPETKDANFTWEEFFVRNNGDLVAAWGNLVNRVVGFTHPRYEGKIPVPQTLDDRDKQVFALIEEAFIKVAKLYQEVKLRDALKEAFFYVREINKYLDEKAPWTAFKTDPQKAGTSIYVAFWAIDSLKTMLAPVIPFSCEKINQMFAGREPLFGSLEIKTKSDTQGSYEVLNYLQNSAEKQSDENLRNRWKTSTLQGGEGFEKIAPLFKVLEAKTEA